MFLEKRKVANARRKLRRARQHSNPPYATGTIEHWRFGTLFGVTIMTGWINRQPALLRLVWSSGGYVGGRSHAKLGRKLRLVIQYVSDCSDIWSN